MSKVFVTSLSFILVIGACSTAKVRVMPGENGIHSVEVRDLEKDDAEEEAVEAAEKYCKKKHAEAVFLKNSSKYTGKMDESTRGAIRKGSKAAMVVGAVGVIPESSRVAGGILSGAGFVGHSMTNDRDYHAEVSFKCKAVKSE